MKRFLRIGIHICLLFVLVLSSVLPFVEAQTFEQFFDFGSYPVDYDQPVVIGRGYKNPDSIDECLKRKEYFFNDVHNIWVDGLERCELNSKGVLSRATYQGVSTDAADEQACKGKRAGQILVNGAPSEGEARRWSERCSYLGTIGGAGPIGTNRSDSNFSNFFDSKRPSRRSTRRPTKRDSSGVAGSNGNSNSTDSSSEGGVQPESGADADSVNKTPVYTGKGVRVPDVSLVASGISKETSLIQLIVFYTNATLPYVSVISVFVFVSAGLYYILSFTNEELNTKAKTMMIYVVIGIVIIFSAYTIVNTLLAFSDFA